MQKESDNFKYCSSDTIRKSPLPFRIAYYPPDRVIDPTGEAISKLSKKLFSVLESEDYDLDSIVVKCQDDFSEKVINGIEKLNKNKRKIKTEIYPGYLWLQMPEGLAHAEVAGALSSFIDRALQADLQGQYLLVGDRPVRINGRSHWKPDCSAVSRMRKDLRQLDLEIPLIPNLVVEVGSSQGRASLNHKVATWLAIANAHGHMVNMAFGVRLTYHDREGTGSIPKTISRGSLFSVKFGVYVGAEMIESKLRGARNRGIITSFPPELQTIEATITANERDERDELVVRFVENPGTLSGNRSRYYFVDPDNNLRFPVDMVDNHNLPNMLPPYQNLRILLTQQDIREIVLDAYGAHEEWIADNDSRAQAREANGNEV